MAFPGGSAEREAMGFNSNSPQNMSGFQSPLSPSQQQQHQQQQQQLQQQHQTSPSDPRMGLQRRFTTESAPQSMFQPILEHQPSGSPDTPDMSSTTYYKAQLLERKKQDHERLKEQKRLFEAEMARLDEQQKREEAEITQITKDLHRTSLPPPPSEPVTPPEQRTFFSSSVFSQFPARSRLSGSSLASPPGIMNRSSISQSGTPATTISGSAGHIVNPSRSVPNTRRNSDDGIAETPTEPVPELPTRVAFNRNSMPARGLALHSADDSELNSLGQVNTTGFLFDDDADKTGRRDNDPTSPEAKSYLQASANDNNFPILRRGNNQAGLLSASSAALDLALSQTPKRRESPSGWPSFARHRQAQHSLPANTLSSFESARPAGAAGGYHQSTRSTSEASPSIRRFDRNSADFSLNSSGFGDFGAYGMTQSSGTAPRLSASFSTNDIPTIRNPNGSANNVHAQQHLHRHNVSLGRIPMAYNRHSRDMSKGDMQVSVGDVPPPFTSPSSAQFPNSAHMGQNARPLSSPTSANAGNGYVSPHHQPGMHPPQYQLPPMGAVSPYNPPGYGPGNFFQNALNNSQQPRSRALQRKLNDYDPTRYHNVELSTIKHEIYMMSKDQHGCRYLQKKVEEGHPEDIAMVFDDILPNTVELMTDPFGNYLCQKLLEHGNDAQRTAMIRMAAPEVLRIATNQHGTRALQKMIEFITTKEQVNILIEAMKDKVVPLIQDLNGNHVIQKCLNRLSSDDAQFIFNDVGFNCVIVGTHRHGCCVLQRCIDHASGDQRARLIDQITNNCFSLVTDPFGNYVVQYILDLGETQFTEPIAKRFAMRTCQLSKQKFSSNVIEKCLRVASPETRRLIISKFMTHADLEKMLRDSYGNYVVQTAMDFADPDTRIKLIEAVKPILPLIRHTPYGRRITTKIAMAENRPNLPVTLTDAQLNLRRPITRDAINAQGNPPAPRPLAYSNAEPAPAPTAFSQEQNNLAASRAYPPTSNTSYVSFAAQSRQGSQPAGVQRQFPSYGPGDQSRNNFF